VAADAAILMLGQSAEGNEELKRTPAGDILRDFDERLRKGRLPDGEAAGRTAYCWPSMR